jgi:hypothetical protein
MLLDRGATTTATSTRRLVSSARTMLVQNDNNNQYNIPFRINQSGLFTDRRYNSTSSEESNPKDDNSDNDDDQPKTKKYLHVGPCGGDVWIGDSIFAAKHLQPNYVKSIPLNEEFAAGTENYIDIDDLFEDLVIEILEQRFDRTKKLYDTGRIPKELRQYIIQRHLVEKNDRGQE